MKNIEAIWVIISLNSLSTFFLFNKGKKNFKNLDEQISTPNSPPCDLLCKWKITKQPLGKEEVVTGVIFPLWQKGSLWSGCQGLCQVQREILFKDSSC